MRPRRCFRRHNPAREKIRNRYTPSPLEEPRPSARGPYALNPDRQRGDCKERPKTTATAATTKSPACDAAEKAGRIVTSAEATAAKISSSPKHREHERGEERTILKTPVSHSVAIFLSPLWSLSRQRTKRRHPLIMGEFGRLRAAVNTRPSNECGPWISPLESLHREPLAYDESAGARRAPFLWS